MLTEEEAKTKWCPHSRGAFTIYGKAGRGTELGAPAGVNRTTKGTPMDFRCIGSLCMAWRWDVAVSDTAVHLRGFCGLAGKP